MNEINLLPKNLRQRQFVQTIRGQVIAWTSIILGVYIVLIAGLAGWWMFVSFEDHQVTDQLAQVHTQLQQYTAADYSQNLVAQRTNLAQQFLSGRSPVASEAGKLTAQSAINVTTWKFGSGTQALTIESGQSLDLENYAEQLQSMFPNIKITTFTGPSGTDTNWSASLTL